MSRLGPEPQVVVGHAKDLAVAAVAALAIGLLIFVPRLLAVGAQSKPPCLRQNRCISRKVKETDQVSIAKPATASEPVTKRIRAVGKQVAEAGRRIDDRGEIHEVRETGDGSAAERARPHDVHQPEKAEAENPDFDHMHGREEGHKDQYVAAPHRGNHRLTSPMDSKCSSTQRKIPTVTPTVIERAASN